MPASRDLPILLYSQLEGRLIEEPYLWLAIGLLYSAQGVREVDPALQIAEMTTVAVVGLGKIGLPLAAQFAGKGIDVIGCDVIPTVVEAINSGRSPHPRGGRASTKRVAARCAAGRLKATTDTTRRGGRQTWSSSSCR